MKWNEMKVCSFRDMNTMLSGKNYYIYKYLHAQEWAGGIPTDFWSPLHTQGARGRWPFAYLHTCDYKKIEFRDKNEYRLLAWVIKNFGGSMQPDLITPG